MKNFPANNNTPIDWEDILHQVRSLAVGGADDREVWCSLAASLQAAGGTETHKQIFLTISRNSGGYRNDADCLSVWRSYRHPRSITVATIIKHLHDNSVKITHLTDWRKIEAIPQPHGAQPQPKAQPLQYQYATEGDTEFFSTSNKTARQCSHLVTFIRNLFWGCREYYEIEQVLQEYRHGYNRYTEHEIFRYYDYTDKRTNLCKRKFCQYDTATGKRVKEKRNNALPLYTVPSRYKLPDCVELYPCFYGEHLAGRYPDKKICIVESEKTALIMAVKYGQFVWLATGGKGLLQSLACKEFLQGRAVILFPDIDAAQEWGDIARAHGWSNAVDKLDWYRDYLTQTDAGAKGDIADLIVTEQQQQMQSSAQRIARAWVKTNPGAWKFMQQFGLYLADDSPDNGK